ncbi:hypothetical protein F751_4732 [Auxenochlorella protothecoides]|uniref:Uncharacterized protein n=1 Tax=Auxenochlorella protothecoides TaxID=3075 RepID=A0A087SKI5_AUXPR|nr:hypothetical protein F751_4732 [Auxenochlorella protothecoides]KFM26239.1 hypothetical protein F751_4732 [Auxenochlorella protothecoides]
MSGFSRKPYCLMPSRTRQPLGLPTAVLAPPSHSYAQQGPAVHASATHAHL